MRTLAVVLITVGVLGGTVGAAPRPEIVDVKSSLAGFVLADDLVEVDARVQDTQPLVYVRTPLTGLKSVAARAPRAGTVREVLVRPGQRVERGDIVVRLTLTTR